VVWCIGGVVGELYCVVECFDCVAVVPCCVGWGVDTFYQKAIKFPKLAIT